MKGAEDNPYLRMEWITESVNWNNTYKMNKADITLEIMILQELPP